MNTEAVMCMAFTSTSPSRMPLSRTAWRTGSVRFTNPRLPSTSSQSSWRWLFIGSPRSLLRRHQRPRHDGRCGRQVVRILLDLVHQILDGVVELDILSVEEALGTQIQQHVGIHPMPFDDPQLSLA